MWPSSFSAYSVDCLQWFPEEKKKLKKKTGCWPGKTSRLTSAGRRAAAAIWIGFCHDWNTKTWQHRAFLFLVSPFLNKVISRDYQVRHTVRWFAYGPPLLQNVTHLYLIVILHHMFITYLVCNKRRGRRTASWHGDNLVEMKYNIGTMSDLPALWLIIYY